MYTGSNFSNSDLFKIWEAIDSLVNSTLLSDLFKEGTFVQSVFKDNTTDKSVFKDSGGKSVFTDTSGTSYFALAGGKNINNWLNNIRDNQLNIAKGSISKVELLTNTNITDLIADVNAYLPTQSDWIIIDVSFIQEGTNFHALLTMCQRSLI